MESKLPVIEAYIGEYASGKSEVAVNRALELIKDGQPVTLVDLDLVEPFYTLRPLKRKLGEQGLTVIAWETRETMGLGEAGSVLKPEMRWVLWRKGHVILDVGYGIKGARILNLVEGARDNKFLRIYVVVNIARPMTAKVEDIINYVESLGKVDGLINNSHLGGETTVEIIQEGARRVSEAAKRLGLKMVGTTVAEEMMPLIGPRDCLGNQVRPMHRYMPDTLW